MVERRKFGSIRTLGSVRYQARLQVDGVHVQPPKPFGTYAEAEEWLAIQSRARRLGDALDLAGEREHFGPFAQRWLDQRTDLRPRTRETYASQLQHATRRFGDTRLSEIRPSAIREWHANLVRTLHRNTAAKVYRLTKQVLETAVDDALISQNPCRVRGAARERLAERPLLADAHVQKLIANIDQRYAAMVEIAAFGGLQFGEVAALRRKDFDLATGAVRIERSLSRQSGQGVIFDPPKSAAGIRTVHLPERAAIATEDHIARFTGPEPEALIFTTDSGGPVENQRFQRCWKEAIAAADLSRAVRFHDLRHYATTIAAPFATSQKDLQLRLGHSSPAMTQHYLKSVEGADADIAAGISRRQRDG